MITNLRRLTVAALLAGLSQAAIVQSAQAQAMIQPQDDARDADDAAEVIVTAQKREQRIEDVPATGSAVTGARVAKRSMAEKGVTVYSAARCRKTFISGLIGATSSTRITDLIFALS